MQFQQIHYQEHKDITNVKKMQDGGNENLIWVYAKEDDRTNLSPTNEFEEAVYIAMSHDHSV